VKGGFPDQLITYQILKVGSIEWR